LWPMKLEVVCPPLCSTVFAATFMESYMPAAATTEAAAISLAAFLLVDLLPCSFLQTHVYPYLSHQRTSQTGMSAADAQQKEKKSFTPFGMYSMNIMPSVILGCPGVDSQQKTDGDEQQHGILCTYCRSLQGSYVHNEKAAFLPT